MRISGNFLAFGLKKDCSWLIRCAAASLALLATQPSGAQRAETGKVEADGTIVVHEMRLPPSQYTSDQFNKAYAKYVLEDVQKWPLAPSLDAPREEWDKYDAEADRLIYGPGYEF